MVVGLILSRGDVVVVDVDGVVVVGLAMLGLISADVVEGCSGCVCADVVEGYSDSTVEEDDNDVGNDSE